MTALELATGVPIVYELDAAGRSIAGTATHRLRAGFLRVVCVKTDGKPFGKQILND